MTSVARGAVELVLLNVALAVACFGQFHNLAVTNDGSLVYFSTNLRLASEAALRLPQTPAIYRVDSAGRIERFSDPPPVDYAFPVGHGNPQVSGDGAVVSYTQTTNCIGGSSCFLSHPPTSFSYLFVNGQAYGDSLGGNAQVSRNGRYVFNYGHWEVFGSPAVTYDELRDLRAGLKTSVLVKPASLQQALTSYGRVLGFDNNGALVLWSVTSTKKIATSEVPQTGIVNDAGTVVVYVSSSPTMKRLRAVDLASGADTILAEAPAESFLECSISNDGALILYVTRPDGAAVQQAWLIHPDGSGRRQLTHFNTGVEQAQLSGFGNAVVAVAGGAIVYIDTGSGDMRNLVGPTPVCSAGFNALVPGSIFPFGGTALADTTEAPTPPLPTEVAGVRVLANDTPLPILRVAPNEVWFQVPFELPLADAITVRLEHGSAFGGCPAVTVPVLSRHPYFFSDGGSLTLAHQDFSGPVTRDNPVQRGEIVHAYAVGLGPVTPIPVTGIPAGTDKLYRLAQPFDCRTGTADTSPLLEVLFAGLAPGMIGIYQVDVRMPAEIPAEGFLLICGTPGNADERHGGFIAAPSQAH